MEKKKVLSICGTGGVTSSVITQKVEQIAKDNGIEVDVTNARALDLQGQLSTHKFDLIVTSTRIKPPNDEVPVVNCMAFLTGVNEETAIKKILEVLKK